MSIMEDNSITRMNLSAIKKIDPYAKDIVDSSSHVAFYTFNSDQNEWEKTDVEGAFFIYNRNGEPFHSIFINNRLNTTSFVEPITGQLEIQSQPPFLLYRNERSRIRGFWFYNSEECDRISNVVNTILQKNGENNPEASADLQITSTRLKNPNSNIFNMLSKAQQEYNAQNVIKSEPNSTPCNVLEFFASAKQTAGTEAQLNRVLPLSVDQIEKQQRSVTPNESINKVQGLEKRLSPILTPGSIVASDLTPPFSALADPKSNIFIGMGVPSIPAGTVAMPFKGRAAEDCLRRLLGGELRPKAKPNAVESKPALMPPTMFDKTNRSLEDSDQHKLCLHRQESAQQPLNITQFVQAFNHLMTNDKEFVQKLHEAYLRTFSKSVFDTTTTYQ